MISRSVTISLVTVVVIAASLLASPALTYAQSSEWDVTISISFSDGTRYEDITHSGNNLVERQTLPYIRVIYPDGPLINDIGTGNCMLFCSYTTDTSTPGRTIYTVEFFVNFADGCEPMDWKNYGCYRYKEIMEFWDVDAGGAGTKARFRPVLQAFGPGLANTSTGYYANYNPYWRIDTDLPTGINNEYFRDKASPGCTTWNDFTIEVTLTPLCPSGEVWRSYDYDVGYSKSLGVDPVSLNPEMTVLRSNTGQEDPTDVNPFCCPSQWDNNELIYVQNQVLWFKASQQQSSTSFYPSFPCKVQSAWILSGNPPW
ncbi:MAG: hypothetical protein MN733_20380 [Nitrososphaera sp.]|nr:hypothetical protein [Nitrososphaera sp.]